MRRSSPLLTLVLAACPCLYLGCGEDPGQPIPTFDGGTSDPREAGTNTSTSKTMFLLVGKVLTPDKAIDGEVLVDEGVIVCVAQGEGCRDRNGAERATVIEGAVIAPGMIDTHNHILFDVFDETDWTPLQKYQNHDQWTQEDRYGAMLDVKQCLANDSQGKPTWCASTPYGTKESSLRCEMDKWGELKGLIAGTTSIVGLPGTSAPCFGSLARSIDVAQNGLDEDKVQTSATFPPSDATAVCENFADKSAEAFLVHCGEGLDAKSLAEFAKLGSSSTPADCLYASQTAITHGTAFTAAEFQIMGERGMKLTWSPVSNAALYGQTTNIPLALDANVLVSLGPDWSMGGSQNMLDELRFARDWDAKNWQRLSPRDLVTMATVNGAKVVALEDRIGQVKEGYLADLVVYSGRASDPYDVVLDATPKEVRFVMVGGIPLYGDEALKDAAPSDPGCETLDVCGAKKFLCVAQDSPNDKLDQTYAQIRDALEKAMVAVDEATPGDGWDFAPLTPLVRCK